MQSGDDLEVVKKALLVMWCLKWCYMILTKNNVAPLDFANDLCGESINKTYRIISIFHFMKWQNNC